MGKTQFKSRLGFILTAAGSAIGLGAIWKFPYIAGISGGGAFFLVFILFTFLLAMPLLLGEFVIGRTASKSAIEAYTEIAPSTKWYLVGALGMVTVFLLLSFYSTIGGWIVIYIFKGITGSLSGDITYSLLFNEISSNPYETLLGHFIFLFIIVYIVSRGVDKGIEKASKIMMPVLFIIFILVIIRSLTLEGAMDGVKFLLYPDFTKLTSKSILFALGQSFFALSLGCSAMVTYSAYLPRESNINSATVSIVLMNLLVILLAGLSIFPGVFTFNLSPAEGPSLLFSVLPNVFSRVPLGNMFFVGFLILFLFAALTSGFSMLEILVSSTIKGDNSKRIKTSFTLGIIIFAVGIPSTLSFGVLSQFKLFSLTYFDTIDFLVSNILMPLGALFISLFIPINMKKEKLFKVLSYPKPIPRLIFNLWYYSIRYLVPISIIIVFLTNLITY
ncbi:MAG: sodium-dependent transporter [Clostridium sp.]|uniref:sodium-dependent transporter n=1 Tax=Clostridium sp. TaxID=1506 RepID=UPI002FC69A2D